MSNYELGVLLYFVPMVIALFITDTIDDDITVLDILLCVLPSINIFTGVLKLGERNATRVI